MKSEQFPLYDARFEHDSCGIGAVISIQGVQSHRTVDDALKIVEKLQHRAGRDASGETGDGVGLLMQIPHKLLCREALKAGLPELGAPRSYGVGMFFFPQDVLSRLQAQKMLEIIKGGATTLLVSHSLEQIRRMATKVLWLDKGNQVAFGETKEICDRYQAFLNGK
jgi:glutamate synthase domain-containing protein 1